MIEHAELALLRDLLPSEVWQHRDVFFFEGMRLTIGPCHRRYETSRAFAAASKEYGGRAHVDEAGNLIDHVAGIPFASESIDAPDPDAGARWAWNLERRYRGAGPMGSFRLIDLPDSRALAAWTSPQLVAGEFFLVQTGARADLPSHQERSSRGNVWVAGGAFREPPEARNLAWRQYRSLESAGDARRADEVFSYLPELRKMRRAAGSRSDGMFVPRYRAVGQSNARVVPYGQGGRIGSIETGHGAALALGDDIDRAFTGLALRPNAWRWRVVAERALIAPLNARTEGWPLRDARNYGPSGLSLASDTWDVRWAVAIEGRARDSASSFPRVTYWVDTQSAQPLYVIRRAAGGGVREIGVLAHRYSGDVARYPAFPSGEPANVFDPVAAAFLALPSGGWRRESWDARSVPRSEAELRALLSTDALTRGR
ncbi:MAG TPA: DUF1329 domain-containing protein [Myxococcota bacterium]|nr:DUF1329 domain-containing protein [Myxococcota bacterium]